VIEQQVVEARKETVYGRQRLAAHPRGRAWISRRAHGITTEITFQSDRGQEFGGDDPPRIARLAANSLWPLRARLKRYPMGRQGYNGHVERNHRTDDEEFH